MIAVGREDFDVERNLMVEVFSIFLVCICVVRPAKAGVFSRRKAYQDKSQKFCSLDSRMAGNQDSEAYRQYHL